MEQERLKIYQLLVADEVITKLTFDDFIKKYFSSDATAKKLYNFLISNKSKSEDVFYYTKSINEFFKKYACDILKYSNYCTQEGFPKCASIKGTAKTGMFGFGNTYIDYTTTVWDKPQIRLSQSKDGSTGEYEILTGEKKGGKGIYKCLEGFKLFLDNPTGVPQQTTPQQTGGQQQTTPTQSDSVKSSATIIQKTEKNFSVSGSDAIIY